MESQKEKYFFVEPLQISHCYLQNFVLQLRARALKAIESIVSGVTEGHGAFVVSHGRLLRELLFLIETEKPPAFGNCDFRAIAFEPKDEGAENFLQRYNVSFVDIATSSE
jgi:hypothetical protein